MPTTVRWLRDGTQAYISWNTNSIWFSGGDVISNTFSGITFTFRRVGPTGTALRPDRYAAGLTTVGWNAKLVSDGIQVEPPHITNIVGVSTAPGARIELTISGLAAGPHTLLAWHNTWQSPASYTFSPINVYLDGTRLITDMPVSNRVTNNADATYSYVSFVADGSNSPVIAYEASTNFTVTDCNVCIDGFELDTPNFKYKANRPSPAHGDEHVDADATRSVLLSWTKATTALDEPGVLRHEQQRGERRDDCLARIQRRSGRDEFARHEPLEPADLLLARGPGGRDEWRDQGRPVDVPHAASGFPGRGGLRALRARGTRRSRGEGHEPQRQRSRQFPRRRGRQLRASHHRFRRRGAHHAGVGPHHQWQHALRHRGRPDRAGQRDLRPQTSIRHERPA